MRRDIEFTATTCVSEHVAEQFKISGSDQQLGAHLLRRGAERLGQLVDAGEDAPVLDHVPFVQRLDLDDLQRDERFTAGLALVKFPRGGIERFKTSTGALGTQHAFSNS